MVFFMLQKRKITMEMVLLLGIAALLAWGTALERQQQRISDAMIRMHVVANSDSAADQEIKLRVRDAVLLEAQRYTELAESREEAVRILSEHLQDFADVTSGVLSENGYSYPVTVSLKRELFGFREYDTFSLPGGYYDALRVTIGSGEGKNWWCVVYPQLCKSAVMEDSLSVGAMGLTEEEFSMLQGDEYIFRFKSLELLENLLSWFRSGRQGIPVSG